VLAPLGIAEHHAFAAALQLRHEAALQVDALLDAAVVAVREPPHCLFDARADGAVAHRGREQQIGVKPALPDPRRPGPADESRPRPTRERGDIDDLELAAGRQACAFRGAPAARAASARSAWCR
jgi:hypothetical protein